MSRPPFVPHFKSICVKGEQQRSGKPRVGQNAQLDGCCTSELALKAASFRTTGSGRECDFADAGNCRPAARRRHRQQSATLLT
jgi:hypothetical protein